MHPSALAYFGRLLWWTHAAILIGTVAGIAGIVASPGILPYGLTPGVLVVPAILFGYVAFASILAGFAYDGEHRRLGVAFFVLGGIASSAFLAPCCAASIMG